MITPETYHLEGLVHSALAKMGSVMQACAFEIIQEEGGLFQDELFHISGATLARRKEFSAGRRCARRALTSLGCGPQPILKGTHHEPIWPPGFFGSISHGMKYAAALAYPNGRYRLTLDIVDVLDSAPYMEVVNDYLLPDETARCADGLEAILVFSAKEAAVKVLSPLLQDYVDMKSLYTMRTPEGFNVHSDRFTNDIIITTIQRENIVVSVGLLSDW